MSGNAKAKDAKFKAQLLIYDKDGNPKVERNQLKNFEPFLSQAEKQYLLNKYNLQSFNDA